jgi:hypothetical protein
MLLGRFLFEEVELLQVLKERLGAGSAFVEQSAIRNSRGNQNWAWRAKRGEREIQTGKVANVLIGTGAIFIAITHMMKGLVINFLNFLRLLPTSCYF